MSIQYATIFRNNIYYCIRHKMGDLKSDFKINSIHSKIRSGLTIGSPEVVKMNKLSTTANC